MAVTIDTLRDEAQVRFFEDTATTTGVFTDAFVLSVINEFYDEREADMQLPLDSTVYTFAAGASAAAFSSISTSLLTITKVEGLDSSGEVNGEVYPRPQGDSYGYFVYNTSLYLNGRDSDSAASSVRVWGTRTITRATSVSDNADVHTGSERAVLLPLFLAKAYERTKRFDRADGYMVRHTDAFDKMMTKFFGKSKPKFQYAELSEAYEPLTG